MKRLWLLTLGLGLAAGLAHAQVAAPSLSPTRIETTAKNPATQQWAPNSVLGAGWVKGTSEESAGGVTTDDGDVDGYLATVRLVGDAFSAGAETVHIEIDRTGTTHKTRYELDELQAALALQAGGTLALGIGYESREETYKYADPLATLEVTVKGTLPIAGGSLRVGQAFYIGLAGGAESIDHKQQSTVAPSFEATGAERNVLRAGAGFYNVDNSGGYHVEVYREQRDPYKLDAAGTVLEYDDSTKNVLSLEALWGNVLLGYEGSREKKDNPSQSQQSDSSAVSLGWVPREGWALVLDYAKADVDQDPGDTTEVHKFYALSAAYQF